MLRQRSRPYLFSNTLAPPVAAASLRAYKLLLGPGGTGLLGALHANTAHFRRGA